MSAKYSLQAVATASQNRAAIESHPRIWQSNRYVYPVISRRSGGLSIGVNLNPDKRCNFDCIYCSVDRRIPGDVAPVDVRVMALELGVMLDQAGSGDLFQMPPFSQVTPELRRLNDIAFSGDGEPTSHPELLECCKIAKAALDARNLASVKIILISNATLLHRPRVQKALEFLDGCKSEIWAKLDAGTPEYYATVDRSAFSFAQLLENIAACARRRPIVIQSLFMKIDGVPPAPEEVDAYGRRLADIIEMGGKLRRVQLYTVARQPAVPSVSPLNFQELQSIAEAVERILPHPTPFPVEIFP